MHCNPQIIGTARGAGVNAATWSATVAFYLPQLEACRVMLAANVPGDIETRLLFLHPDGSFEARP
jgi:hypothetical protein